MTATTDTATVVIDRADALDRWRFRCPRGHAQWEPTNYHFWCHACAEYAWDVDPEFDELVDTKTGERNHRSEIAFR